MSKDPAFLFYSKDFYEGTRMMLPEERACYIDLLIYQHQHDKIPNEPKRLTLYCSGIDQATLEATLEAKFVLNGGFWTNKKLESTIKDRTEFKGKQAVNGKIGQFWKKSKAQLKASVYKDLRTFIYSNFSNKSLNKELEKNEGSYQGLLEAMLKQCVIANAIVNEDINNNGRSKPKKKFIAPELKDVIKYFHEKGYKTSVAKTAFEFYDVANWIDSKGNAVKNWKQKMLSVWMKDENKESINNNQLPEILKGLADDHPHMVDWHIHKILPDGTKP